MVNQKTEKKNYSIYLYSVSLREPNEVLAGRDNQEKNLKSNLQFSHSVVSDSATQWPAAHQASLSIANSLGLLKLMSIELVMPSSHLILCSLLLPSIFPSIRVFSNESVLCIKWPKYWSFSFRIR